MLEISFLGRLILILGNHNEGLVFSERMKQIHSILQENLKIRKLSLCRKIRVTLAKIHLKIPLL